MNQVDTDLLVIAIYVISVVLVLSIKNPLNVKFEKNAFTEYKDKLGIAIDISFEKLDGQYQAKDKITKLRIKIENKSLEDAIRIDWDKSSFVDVNGEVHRIVRSPIGLDPDANKTANVSLVPPTQKYPADLITEDIVKKSDTPLIDLEKLKSGKFPYRFSLWLFTEVFNVYLKESKPRVCILDCRFTISETPFQWSDIFKLPKR